MQAPPLPDDEDARLEALYAYDILDTLPEERFERLADLAATVADKPMAWITLVDEDRQWIKSCIGVDLDETDREISFCGHAILQPDEIMVVEDATEDPRFEDNPLVTSGTPA